VYVAAYYHEYKKKELSYQIIQQPVVFKYSMLKVFLLLTCCFYQCEVCQNQLFVLQLRSQSQLELVSEARKRSLSLSLSNILTVNWQFAYY